MAELIRSALARWRRPSADPGLEKNGGWKARAKRAAIKAGRGGWSIEGGGGGKEVGGGESGSVGFSLLLTGDFY